MWPLGTNSRNIDGCGKRFREFFNNLINSTIGGLSSYYALHYSVSICNFIFWFDSSFFIEHLYSCFKSCHERESERGLYQTCCNLNLCIKTVPVTSGLDATVYIRLLFTLAQTPDICRCIIAPRFHLKLKLCDYYILNCLCLLSVSAFSLGAWRLCSGRLDKMWGFECLEATCIVCYHWANPIGHRYASKQMFVYSNRREVLLENFRI